MNKFPFALPEKESKKIIFRNTFIREKKNQNHNFKDPINSRILKEMTK